MGKIWKNRNMKLGMITGGQETEKAMQLGQGEIQAQRPLSTLATPRRGKEVS